METTNLPALSNAEEIKKVKGKKDTMVNTNLATEVAEWVTPLTKWEI